MQNHDIHHSHSKLIHRLDEVDAHIQALRECEDCHLIHRELQAFTRAFYEALVSHVAHEETELFPSVDNADRLTLIYLQVQHLEMIERAALLKRKVMLMKEDLYYGTPDVEELATLVDEIRDEMRDHSAGEAAFLRGEAHLNAHREEVQ